MMFNINLDIYKAVKFFFEKGKIEKEENKKQEKERENYDRVKKHNENSLKKWKI